jgi:putative tricarboxylic transport membrane protein
VRKANFVAALLFLALTLYVVAVTFTFKKFKNVPIGPEFFPRWLALGLGICALVLLYQSVKHYDKREAPTLSLRDKGMQRLLIGVAVVIAYVFLWKSLGFLVMTPLLLFALMFLLEVRDYKVMILISLLTSVGIFLAFKLILGIEMPLGFLSGVMDF